MVATGCKSSKNSSGKSEKVHSMSQPENKKVNKTVIPEDFLFQIQKTPCFGACPTYKLEVNDSGEVKYFGQRFVEKKGVFTKKLNSADLNKLYELTQKKEFADLKDVYDNEGITDLPSSIIIYNANGIKKTIKCRYGCPESFHSFIKQAETIIGENGYTKSEEEDK